MKKFYLKQSFSKIIEIEVEEHLKYDRYVLKNNRLVDTPYILKNLCFDTQKEAVDYAVQELNMQLFSAHEKVHRIRNKIEKLITTYHTPEGEK